MGFGFRVRVAEGVAEGGLRVLGLKLRVYLAIFGLGDLKSSFNIRGLGGLTRVLRKAEGPRYCYEGCCPNHNSNF